MAVISKVIQQLVWNLLDDGPVAYAPLLCSPAPKGPYRNTSIDHFVSRTSELGTEESQDKYLPIFLLHLLLLLTVFLCF